MVPPSTELLPSAAPSSVHHFVATPSTYSYRTLSRNVALLTPELLAAVNRLVVGAGHELVGHRPPEPLQARCDSFTVETDVHYPTDVSLLWDALRCLIPGGGARLPAAQHQRLATEHASDHERVESVQPGTFMAATTRQAKAGCRPICGWRGIFRNVPGRRLEQLAAAAADADVQEEIKCYLETYGAAD